MILLVRAEIQVIVDYVIRFTEVTQYGVVSRKRFAIVHQSVASAHSPQRCCAHPVCTNLTAVLDNSITGTDIVQQKITERMNDLVAQRCRDCELSAVNYRARR